MDEIIKVNVYMNNDMMVTDSRNVSEVFGKRHDHTLRDISNIKKDAPNFGEMFFEDTKPDKYGREQKIYYMNRDGFTLLAMGFTGKDAIQWKLQYINAFNLLEKALNSPELLMARALKEADKTINKLQEQNKFLLEKKEQAEKVIEEQKPLVDFADRVSNTDESITIGKFAKFVSDKGIKTGRNRLFQYLRDKDILMEDNIPYQQYIDSGYFKVKEVWKRNAYGKFLNHVTLITGKGQLWLNKKLVKDFC